MSGVLADLFPGHQCFVLHKGYIAAFDVVEHDEQAISTIIKYAKVQKKLQSIPVNHLKSLSLLTFNRLQNE